MNGKISVMNSISFSSDELKDMIARYAGPQQVPEKVNVITDTSNFFRVEYNDVVVLNTCPYLIRRNEREGRFGIDEQPKYWVKRAIDLRDGSIKIIKMVFPEKFRAKVGDLTFDLMRSPKKEARILELVRGHPNFMQGFSTVDTAGNIIRVIDYIPGTIFDDMISKIGGIHEDYFYSYFPSIFNDYIDMVKAIKFLHDNGEKHGDIRRDHIIKGKGEGHYRWIDFDYNYWHRENMFGYDLFGLGNVLVYLAGAGDVTTLELQQKDQSAYGRLSFDDINIIFNNRVVNLKKIYPYIPDVLNLILLHFSRGADVFYDDTKQFLEDLYEARSSIGCS
ncbi:MAG: protein kinase family protein [Nitrospiraceae bacterium]|nr:MAG: protein kinase family protein [Nitrospiraceae bacterium]